MRRIEKREHGLRRSVLLGVLAGCLGLASHSLAAMEPSMAPAARAVAPDPALIAYYPLDGNGDDASGQGRDLATHYGDQFPQYQNKYSPGKFGKALGVPKKDYQGIGLEAKPGKSFPDQLDSFTIMAWLCVVNLEDELMMRNTASYNVTSQTLRVGIKPNAGIIEYWYFPSDRTEADSFHSTGHIAESAMGDSCQTWNHVAVTFDRASSVFSIYLNGSLDSVHTITMSSTATMSSLFDGDLQPQYSVVDDFAYFAFDLSAEQVNTVYTANKPLSELLPLKPVSGSNDWVTAHNRHRVDLPAYDGGKSISPALQWDATLAGMAQKWADHLATRPNGSCAIFHSTPAFFGTGTPPYGENINMFSFPVSAYQSVDAYVNSEKSFFDPSTSTCTCQGSPICCGHYTQIISQLSAKVGCAQAKCKDGAVENTISVCTYGGPGNIVRGDVFDELYPRQQPPYGGAPSKTYSEIMRSLADKYSSSLTWNGDLAKAAEGIKNQYSQAKNGPRDDTDAKSYAPGFSQYWVCDIGVNGNPMELVASSASEFMCSNVVNQGPLVGMAVTEANGKVRSVMVFGKR